jgi:hypothetical protein
MRQQEQAEPAGQQAAAAVVEAIWAWRAQHPRATLTELEAALDTQLDGLRAQLLEALALASAATAGGSAPAGQPRCLACDGVLAGRGRRTREVVTRGDRVLRLQRAYLACPRCGSGHFPPG